MLIKCSAPIRICDLGGWTDTWFAGKGAVLNIAVFPSVEVLVLTGKIKKGEDQITIHVENYKDTYGISSNASKWTKHPLIEAAFRLFKVPADLHLDVWIHSEAPAGASTGTSAAVSVAIIGALDLISGGSLTSHEIARNAHYVETEILKYQAGIQDQLSSAYGGINFIEINKYPEASVSPLHLPEKVMWELENRLLLVYLGKPHSSSEVHKYVIKRLETSTKFRKLLQPLREAAIEGKNCLLRSDLNGFGSAMISNTTAQKMLHSDLVGKSAESVLELANEFGVSGYKVNGAGGAGGSVTLLLKADTSSKQEFINELQKLNNDYRVIPVRLAPQGLRRWNVQP